MCWTSSRSPHTPIWLSCGDDDDDDAPRDQIWLSGLERTQTWILIFKIISPCLLYLLSAVMTNTRRQLIGWCLKQSTAPRWRSSAGPDWACSLTPSSVRTPLLILTSRGSHRAQVLKPGNTCTSFHIFVNSDIVPSVIIKCYTSYEWVKLTLPLWCNVKSLSCITFMLE